MAWLEPAGVAFLLILLAEFGDKTQLVLVTLAARGRRLPMFLGAAAAFAVLTAVAVLAADLIARVLPPFWIGLIGGALFIGFGLLVLREGVLGERERDETRLRQTSDRNAFIMAFSFVALAELGDKTQIAVAVLAAETGAPVAVGLGAWLALILLAALALLFGGLLAKHVPQRVMRLIAGMLFLAIGLFLLVAGARDAGAALGTLMSG